MNTWNDAKRRVWHLDKSYAERSDCKSLTLVLTKCQQWGLEPEYAQYANVAPVSNLRTAAAELKRAVRWGDREALRRILKLCATLDNASLRLELRLVDLEDIPVGTIDGKYALLLTPGQFEELRYVMRLRHRYVVGGEPREVEPVEQMETRDVYQ